MWVCSWSASLMSATRGRRWYLWKVLFVLYYTAYLHILYSTLIYTILHTDTNILNPVMQRHSAEICESVSYVWFIVQPLWNNCKTTLSDLWQHKDKHVCIKYFYVFSSWTNSCPEICHLWAVREETVRPTAPLTTRFHCLAVNELKAPQSATKTFFSNCKLQLRAIWISSLQINWLTVSSVCLWASRLVQT